MKKENMNRWVIKFIRKVLDLEIGDMILNIESVFTALYLWEKSMVFYSSFAESNLG